MFANLLYLIALTLLSPVIAYRMIRHGRYRRGVGEKLWGISKSRAAQIRGDHKCLWIHAVSVGEVNLLPGIVRELQRQTPEIAIAISTSTDSGYDLAVNHFGQSRVFFCPLDFTWAVKRTFRHLSPQQLVLAELELWPNLIRIAREQGCQVKVINGRLSERSSLRYQKFTALTRATFSRLNWVGCQDQLSRDRFAACGTAASQLAVTGSLKFDDAPRSRETPAVQACLQWAGVDPWHRVWVVGSTQAGEEAMALEIYESLRPQHPELRLILVPRHQERFAEVARLIVNRGLTLRQRSKDKLPNDDQWSDDLWNAGTVVLIDTIGELRNWWGVAQIATVGGSFTNRGGQNMLEPSGYGAAVSFGPDTRNFQQIASMLLDAEGAVRVADQAELSSFVKRCLTDIPAADSLGRSARLLVETQRGATERTILGLMK